MHFVLLELREGDVKASAMQIVINGGRDGAVVVDNVCLAQQEHNNKRYGYDVLTNRYVDMIEAGIIDPAKVARSALQNAPSIAAMILLR